MSKFLFRSLVLTEVLYLVLCSISSIISIVCFDANYMHLVYAGITTVLATITIIFLLLNIRKDPYRPLIIKAFIGNKIYQLGPVLLLTSLVLVSMPINYNEKYPNAESCVNYKQFIFPPSVMPKWVCEYDYIKYQKQYEIDVIHNNDKLSDADKVFAVTDIDMKYKDKLHSANIVMMYGSLSLFIVSMYFIYTYSLRVSSREVIDKKGDVVIGNNNV